VSVAVSARQLEANGHGEETEVPMHTWFDVAVFGVSQVAIESRPPLYLKKHLLHSGTNTFTIHVAEKPAYVAVDPYEKMPDKRPDNNGLLIGQ
jgi:ABC-2 type transport system permease protein